MTRQDDAYWVPTLELWKRVGQTDKRSVANLSRAWQTGNLQMPRCLHGHRLGALL